MHTSDRSRQPVRLSVKGREILHVIPLINAAAIPQRSFPSRLGFVSQQQSHTRRAYDRIIRRSRCNPVVTKVYF